MKNKPLISVIVPIYKTENYLSRCVESIINQSYSNIEIILVDDGSTDKCPQICDNYSLLDTRIKVIHKNNGGISSARNAGLDSMKGEYVTFIDSDDFIYKDFLRILIIMCLKHQCEISLCELIYGSGSDFNLVSRKGIIKYYNKIDAFMSRKMKASIVGKLYKASLFINERFPVSDHFNYEDEAVSYRLVYKANRVGVTDKFMYYYFQSPVSTTRNSNHFKSTDFIEVFENRITFFEEKEIELLELSWEYYCLCLMFFYMSCKKDKYNTNRKDEILTIYRESYKKVMHHHITTLLYKLMFTVFYMVPNGCSFVVNTLHLRS